MTLDFSKKSRPFRLNRLYALLLRFPNKRYNMRELTKNSNITIEIIDRHPEIEWDYSAIYPSKRGLTKEFVTIYQETVFLHTRIYVSRIYTWKDVEGLLGELSYQAIRLLFEYKKLDLKYIYSSPNLIRLASKCYDLIARNWHLTWKEVEETPNLQQHLDFILEVGKMVFPLHIIEKYHGDLGQWERISRQENITLEFVENHLDYPWAWSELCKKRWFTTEQLAKFAEKIFPQNEKELTEHLIKNPNFSFEYLLKNELLDFFWKHCDRHCYQSLNSLKIPLDYLKKNGYLKYIINYSDRADIPIEFIKLVDGKTVDIPNLAKDCNYKDKWNAKMCERSDLKCTDILSNIDRVIWDSISRNNFGLNVQSATIIQRKWRLYKATKNHKENTRKLVEEIQLLPAGIVKEFPGGEEYRKAATRFALY